MQNNSKKNSSSIILREPDLNDEHLFLTAMKHSESLHYPYVKAPTTSLEFHNYVAKYNQSNQKSYLAVDSNAQIIGVFNINDIVRGLFQNAYLGYYATAEYAGRGLMSQALKLVLENVFNDLKLHRLEANIQPENKASIHLVRQNGFREEGYSPKYLFINNEWRDHVRFALTYEDWLNAHGDNQ